MFKKSKGFLVGVLFTILAMAGAAQLGWVKIDITITEKGAAVIQSGKAALNTVQTEATGLLGGGSKSDGQ
jgi:hypothetical protein